MYSILDILFTLNYYVIAPAILAFTVYTLPYTLKHNEPTLISIDGNIGSGKSTLIEFLKKKCKDNTNITFLEEPVSQWINTTDNNNKNVLEMFYEDKNRWSYIFQNFAFITRATILLKAIKKNSTNIFSKKNIIISERSVETDKYVFAKMLNDDNHMNNLEYTIYKTWYDTLFPEIKVKNVIYVRTFPETAYNRMINRKRKEESSVPKSYIQMVHKYHDEWLTKNESGYNICYLDGNKDMNDDNNILNDHYEKILQFIQSIN
tara:strand:- start:3328 stop:4113 length:786 start_codon:yes stop_codon:yes gene_type:complete